MSSIRCRKDDEAKLGAFLESIIGLNDVMVGLNSLDAIEFLA